MPAEVYIQILKDLSLLDSFKDYTQTPEKDFKGLQFVYIERISITKQMLMNLFYELPINEGIENMNQRWVENQTESREELIKLFELKGIRYEIQEDNSIKYYH